MAKTVEILVDRALKKGGRDNITVVLCEIMEAATQYVQTSVKLVSQAE